MSEYVRTMNMTEAAQSAYNAATNDPWIHRSRGMRCSSCVWFVAKMPGTQKITDRGLLGRCRRRAPTLNGFPAVFESDWCGDHKIDEMKA